MMWDNGDGRWDSMHDGGAGWFMALVMLVLVAAAVVAVVVLMRGALHASAAQGRPARRAAEPRTILQERFARGEIDEQDFRARIRALDESGSADG